MDRIKELMEQRANALNRAREIINKAKEESRDLSADEKVNYEAAVKDAQDCKAEADNIKAQRDAEQERFDFLDQAEREIAEFQEWAQRVNARGTAVRPEIDGERSNGPTDQDRALAIQGWFLNNSPEGTGAEDRHVDAANCCNRHIRPGSQLALDSLDHGGYQNMRHGYFNSLSTQVGSQGGFLVGDDMVQTIEVNMLHYNSIEQFADVIVTLSGADMPWPTLDDTSNKGSQVGEGKPPQAVCCTASANAIASNRSQAPLSSPRLTPLQLTTIELVGRAVTYSASGSSQRLP